MIYGYKSIKTLIAKVYRDLHITEESRWTSMIEWAAEALELIGVFYQYVPKTVDLEVVGKRVALPCDLHDIQQISFQGRPLVYGSGTFDTTDDCADCKENKTISQFVYTVNDSFINTNFDGIICLSYTAVPLDEDGFPLIPDDISFSNAIEAYIVKMLYYPDLLRGTINPNLYDKLENDWNYKCMQARGKGNMPSLDQMESIKNSWLRIMPQINEHAFFFNDLSKQESIRLGKR